MKKDFLQTGDVTKNIIETLDAAKLGEIWKQRVRDVARNLSLKLDGNDLVVGEDCFFGSSEYTDKPVVVKAMCKGYVIQTDFNSYDDETGVVDTHISPIFIDDEGREYEFEQTCTSIYDNEKDAREALEEMMEDLCED